MDEYIAGCVRARGNKKKWCHVSMVSVHITISQKTPQGHMEPRPLERMNDGDHENIMSTWAYPVVHRDPFVQLPQNRPAAKSR